MRIRIVAEELGKNLYFPLEGPEPKSPRALRSSAARILKWQYLRLGRLRIELLDESGEVKMAARRHRWLFRVPIMKISTGRPARRAIASP
jgi:hypothetical protein